ncbi:MAG: MBL fold metallo-hydrolase [Bdellovibrionota bacterium]
MLNVQRLRGGPWNQNCFLVASATEAILIDPGGHADEALAALDHRKLDLVAILNTHGHFDHIGGVQPLLDVTQAVFYISAREVPVMKTSNMLRFIFKSKDKVVVPSAFTDLDALPHEMTLAGLDITCIETPGHTPGGYCFLIQDHLFSGDTILRTFPANADLPGGDPVALGQSVERLKLLPRDLMLHPGHGRDLPLGEALDGLGLPLEPEEKDAS